MSINILKNILPWRLRLFIHEFLVKHPRFDVDVIKQKKTDYDYNLTVFENHIKKMKIRSLEGTTMVEMGPGDSLTHAAIAYDRGVEKTYLLDIADLASANRLVSTDEIDKMCVDLKLKNIKVFDSQSNVTMLSFMKQLNAVYLIDGLRSYYEVPTESVDFIFSQAVLEHVRLRIFEDTIKETYRMCKHGAICSHEVDFSDHLGGKLNHLRFSADIWEDELHTAMPNYVNRLGLSRMLEIFLKCGFEIVDVEKGLFDKPQIDRVYLDSEFREWSDDELLISCAWIVVKKP